MLGKFVFLSSILAVALAQVPPQSCFPTGTGPATDCIPFIGDFCQGFASTQVSSRETISHCFNAPNGKRCDISAFNARGGRSVFNPGNCQGVLNSIAKQCPPGGSFTPDAFTFTLDPNAGPCPSGVQGSN